MAVADDNYASKKVTDDKDHIYEESLMPAMCVLLCIFLCFGIIIFVILLNIFGYKVIGG